MDNSYTDQTTNVTVDQVKQDMRIFQKMDDGHITWAIQSATNQANSDQIQPLHFDEGVIDFAQHLLYRDWFMSYGGVSAASTFGNSQTLINTNGVDQFLISYNNVVAQFGVDSEMGDVWTEWASKLTIKTASLMH